MFMLVVLHLAAKSIAFCTKTPCILHQNTLHFVPKRTAFCGKTHVILHQNAPLLAVNSPKSGVNDVFFK